MLYEECMRRSKIMQEKRRKRIPAIIAIALVLFMLGQTFAFWTQEVQVKNEYQLGNHSTEIVEEFNSPDNWIPGQDVTKKVSVLNASSFPVFVKAQISLKWLGNNPTTGEAYGLTFLSEQSETPEYAALVTFGSDVVLLNSGVSSTPSLSLGLPTVNTIQEATGKWLLLQETPDSESNLTFFYIGSLATNESTPLLIESVKLNTKIEASTTESTTTYDKTTGKWITTTTTNSTSSYEDAKFLLTVNAHTVQASIDAVKEVFASSTLSEQGVVAHLTTLGIDAPGGGVANNTNSKTTNGTVGSALGRSTSTTNTTTAPPKTLHFEEVNGNLTFTPHKSVGSDQWFMSFLNMLPGVAHTDSINIENRTNKAQNLYMQVIPLANQADHLDELLELIHMKVYHGNELIYDGTALGKSYTNSKQNLHDVIALGEYAAKATNNIRVELKLDKDVSHERAEHLTEIDWKFMAVEVPDPAKPTVTPTQARPMPPKTGDDNALVRYIVMMAVAMVGLGICILMMKKKGREKQGLKSNLKS